jgi:nucleotide-binding universal stress UspA family protein
MLKRILVPLDGSTVAEGVLPYVRALAPVLKAKVELLKIGERDAAVDIANPMVGQYMDRVGAALRSQSEDYLDGIKRTFKDVVIGHGTRIGKPAEIIAEEGDREEDTLIAMSTHGRGGVGRWLMGSVTDKVIHLATTPMLVVKSTDEALPESETELKTIIVPLDGSVLAEAVLPMAMAIAKALKLEVLLIRSISLPTTYAAGPEYAPWPTENFTEEMEKQSTDALDKTAAQLKLEGVEKIRIMVVTGPPAIQVVDIAKETPNSLVIMSTHGRSGVGRFVLGSVADRVVRHAGSPVLLMRAGVVAPTPVLA